MNRSDDRPPGPHSHNRGRRRDEIRLGYRRYASGSHLVLYVSRDGAGVDIIRILHQRMDPTRHM